MARYIVGFDGKWHESFDESEREALAARWKMPGLMDGILGSGNGAHHHHYPPVFGHGGGHGGGGHGGHGGH